MRAIGNGQCLPTTVHASARDAIDATPGPQISVGPGTQI